MTFVHLGKGVEEAIGALLVRNEASGPIRIDLQFQGCCDPSLSLAVDRLEPADLVQETESVTFVIRPETHDLSGDVDIALVEEGDTPGFSLTSAKALSEWQGFGVSRLRFSSGRKG